MDVPAQLKHLQDQLAMPGSHERAQYFVVSARVLLPNVVDYIRNLERIISECSHLEETLRITQEAAVAAIARAETAEAASNALLEATHRHIKRGTFYRVAGRGSLQSSAPISEGAELVYYIGENGDGYMRPASEFDDGRFETLLTEDHLPIRATIVSPGERELAELRTERDRMRQARYSIAYSLSNYGKAREIARAALPESTPPHA